ncbi:MAG TPA: peptide deformylase [Rhodospirillaceae bacterium]|nr:peptide deformylase [Rhodospirillaceae bacterium]HAA92683.1 peptide deformylase [Rhodospirillaceae bacterium]HAT34084.1 peptide deformylase [Rhodospirillaceae bacterium]|tara:strand:+ start:272 stop:790 length:519 start_codon:yes stop_codon:yes gene_type:complete
MPVLPIIIAPDPRLKKKSEAVETVDANVSRLMEDMLETMYLAPGIGLAAPQVDVLKQVIVIDVTKGEGEREPICMANPELLWQSEETNTHEEGCLSLPDQFEEVTRPAKIKVRYLNEKNEEVELDADGLLATCIQHEIDHLQGTLFVDYLSHLKRGMILRKLKKIKKQKASA